jgi:predicted RNA-binding Zn-ribbon protein involved in translation (DUF1610 family)
MGYGLPLRCPNCTTRWLVPGLKRGTWFVTEVVSQVWQLKVPGAKAMPCPNCGAPLIRRRD